MNYLLDTNVILLGIRAGKDWAVTRQRLGLDRDFDHLAPSFLSLQQI